MRGEHILAAVLAMLVLAVQVRRLIRGEFYAPVSCNQKMAGHVLNARYGLSQSPGIDYKLVNRCYFLCSVVALLVAAVLCVLGRYMAGVIACIVLYQVLYAVVSALIARKYR